MAASYWESTQCRNWTISRTALANIRADLELRANPAVLRRYPLPERRLMHLYFWHQLSKLGKSIPPTNRQHILATAQVFIRRFYLKVHVHETNPFSVVSAAFYLASKAEECPVHLRHVYNEARQLWPDLIPISASRLAEYEFAMVSELKSQLILHQPYLSLTNLQQKLNLTCDEKILAWCIINDHYVTDLPLLFPPHIIAMTAVVLAISMMLTGRVNMPRNGIQAAYTSVPATPQSSSYQPSAEQALVVPTVQTGAASFTPSERTAQSESSRSSHTGASSLTAPTPALGRPDGANNQRDKAAQPSLPRRYDNNTALDTQLMAAHNLCQVSAMLGMTSSRPCPPTTANLQGRIQQFQGQQQQILRQQLNHSCHGTQQQQMRQHQQFLQQQLQLQQQKRQFQQQHSHQVRATNPAAQQNYSIRHNLPQGVPVWTGQQPHSIQGCQPTHHPPNRPNAPSDVKPSPTNNFTVYPALSHTSVPFYPGIERAHFAAMIEPLSAGFSNICLPERLEEALRLISQSHMNLQDIADCVFEMYNLYQVWDQYREAECKELLSRLVKGREMDK